MDLEGQCSDLVSFHHITILGDTVLTCKVDSQILALSLHRAVLKNKSSSDKHNVFSKTAIVLVCSPLALISIMTKSNLEEERANLTYVSRSQTIIEGSQAGTEAETMEDAAFCSCSDSFLI